jgi:hypothetical protein
MKRLVTMILAGIALSAAAAAGNGLPKPIIPDCMGVNIHFTGRNDKHVAKIAEGGFRFIRMDFHWSSIETEKGEYNWKPYDDLVDSLAERGIRAVFILDYGHPLYDSGLSPYTDEGRAAFARFAAAGVAHFKGRGVIWELWNEPNGGMFWKPTPSAEDYVRLARVVYPAVKKADPDAFLMGPALATGDFAYLEAVLKRGLLDYIDALSVHPYGSIKPEDAYGYYETCRKLMRKHGRKGKQIPIVSGEWGFSAVRGLNVDRQGEFIVREYLVNLANDVPLSIWYDWIDDGPDPEEKEHHFGTMYRDFAEKPAYKAAQVLAAQLQGYRFAARLDSAAEDYLMLFSKGTRTCLVAWTTGDPHRITLPVDVTKFTRVSLLGERSEIEATSGELRFEVGGAAQYIKPSGSPDDVSARWLLEANWSPSVRECPGASGRELAVKSSVDVKGVKYEFYAGGKRLAAKKAGSTFRMPYLPDGSGTGEIRIIAYVPGLRQALARTVTFANESAPIVQLVPPSADVLKVAVSVPDTWPGGPFQAMLSVRDCKGIAFAEPMPVSLTREGERKVVELTMAKKPAGLFSCSIVLTDNKGRVILKTPVKRYSIVETFSQGKPGEPVGGYDIKIGESKVPGEAQLIYAESPEWGPGPVCGKISYRFDPGWQWLQVVPKSPLAIVARPTSASIWIKGQKNGSAALLRLRGADGQTFNTRYGTLDTKQWEILTADLVNGRTTYWGGNNDGLKRLPLTWESLVVIENQSKQAITGEVLIGPILLCYD